MNSSEIRSQTASFVPLSETTARKEPAASEPALPSDAFARSGDNADLGLIPSMYPLVGGKLSDSESEKLLETTKGWDLKSVEGFPRLQREYKFKNFVTAMKFSNSVAEFAEKQGHHPTLQTEWGKVTVGWWTHDVGGLHANDFLSAQRTDAVFLHGNPPKTAKPN